MTTANAPAPESLGPAETIIQSLLTYTDHMYHGRPGALVPDPGSVLGVTWIPVTHKVEEDGRKTVFEQVKNGKKTERVPIGTMNGDGRITGGSKPSTYKAAGIFDQVAVWFYRQIAKVWQMDNEFAARWASYAFAKEHRDLKVVLAAFMLVQSRKGDPVREGGEIVFQDDDYRDVGEAMMLTYVKDNMSPKMLWRVREVLRVPGIAAINVELGFTKSAKNPFLGRWPKVVGKWLRYREQNPKVLQGLVKNGYRRTVIDLANFSHYEPLSDRFYEILRWKQKQAPEGHRTIAIGKAVRAAESWKGLGELQICERIERDKPDWKRITGLVPTEVGITRAIMTAAIEAGCLSDSDLVIAAPTLEELGLLGVPAVRTRYEAALTAATNARATNIAKNVRSKVVAEKLEAAADKAVQREVAEVMRGLVIDVLIDSSGSMQNSLELAKPIVAKLVQAFPLDKIHVATFNTQGREIQIKHASEAGVLNAFKGLTASGGTSHGAGVLCLKKYKPAADEDLIMIFIGDEQDQPFTEHIRSSGLTPIAFGLLKMVPNGGVASMAFLQSNRDVAVRETARQLGIPCFVIDPPIFADPYTIGRTIRNLIASAPIGVAGAVPKKRVSLVEQILATPLLQKPAWA